MVYGEDTVLVKEKQKFVFVALELYHRKDGSKDSNLMF